MLMCFSITRLNGRFPGNFPSRLGTDFFLSIKYTLLTISPKPKRDEIQLDNVIPKLHGTVYFLYNDIASIDIDFDRCVLVVVVRFFSSCSDIHRQHRQFIFFLFFR